MTNDHPRAATARATSKPVGPPSKHQLALMIWIAVFPALTVSGCLGINVRRAERVARRDRAAVSLGEPEKGLRGRAEAT